MITILGREPVLWLGLISALISLGVGFGLKVTPEQLALIMAAVTAVLSFVARAAVTPLAGQR